MKRILPLAFLASLIAAPAPGQDTAPTAARACLRFGEIYSWKALDNRTVIAEDNRHNKFRLALMGYCPNVQFKERIGFQSPGSTYLSCMSPGDTLLVNQFGTGTSQRCPVSSIAAYTPAMEEADKAKAAAAGQQ
jgi:Family of unknown function (DUF6491)